jgi:hypothetical protein
MQFVIHKSTSVYECIADKPAIGRMDSLAPGARIRKAKWTQSHSRAVSDGVRGDAFFGEARAGPHSRLMQNRHVMNQRRRLAICEFTSSNGELDPRRPNGPFCRESLPYPELIDELRTAGADVVLMDEPAAVEEAVRVIGKGLVRLAVDSVAVMRQQRSFNCCRTVACSSPTQRRADGRWRSTPFSS